MPVFPIRSGARRALGAALLGLAAVAASAQDMNGGTDIARRAIHVCAACHGEGGRSASAAYPSLAGQPVQYTARQLKDFRAQQRAEADNKAYMWGVSALLDDDTIQALAEYYAVQAPAPGRARGPDRLLKEGRRLFEDGVPGSGIRACAGCHGERAEGAAGFPRLAGQHADYLERQLKGFSTRLRPHGVLMRAETAGMSAQQMKAVAAYLQSL
ncbi:c-type cytochrome [Ideonella sp. 4Y16]|uniref:C-type cytochrome n=1 Tax=Ideonella alba TaxID=2824118 RepID=A0A941BJP1_9BURK|nr:c-type cytochrome [Ideonella alba]MBQ0929299.1 c-type cytochrome [Ideonella alba]MBQ0945410.1 c-type cytochrome [Ideonella alba]